MSCLVLSWNWSTWTSEPTGRFDILLLLDAVEVLHGAVVHPLAIERRAARGRFLDARTAPAPGGAGLAGDAFKAVLGHLLVLASWLDHQACAPVAEQVD